jgi:hypothetical protein
MVFASVVHFLLNRDDPQATPCSDKAMIAFACLFILGFATVRFLLLSRFRIKGCEPRISQASQPSLF